MEGSAEVSKSAEGERVTSSGGDFTAAVALILTSSPPSGELRLPPASLSQLHISDDDDSEQRTN